MRAICGFAVIVFFIVRLAYRAVVKRDLMEKPDELYLGAGFIVVWLLIYLLIYVM